MDQGLKEGLKEGLFPITDYTAITYGIDLRECQVVYYDALKQVSWVKRRPKGL
jgi:hypothetical protein